MSEPLWRVMERAYDLSHPSPDQPWTGRFGVAAELRAIADEIEKHDIDPLEIEDWLRAEAIRAEEGEQQ